MSATVRFERIVPVPGGIEGHELPLNVWTLSEYPAFGGGTAISVHGSMIVEVSRTGRSFRFWSVTGRAPTSWRQFRAWKLYVPTSLDVRP